MCCQPLAAHPGVRLRRVGAVEAARSPPWRALRLTRRRRRRRPADNSGALVLLPPTAERPRQAEEDEDYIVVRALGPIVMKALLLPLYRSLCFSFQRTQVFVVVALPGRPCRFSFPRTATLRDRPCLRRTGRVTRSRPPAM